MAHAEGTIRVVVARTPARGQVALQIVEVPEGATVAEVLRAAGPGHVVDGDAPRAVGIWGRITTLDACVRDGDRVELYRPLTVDPKQARRLRYRQHHDKTAAR